MELDQIARFGGDLFRAELEFTTLADGNDVHRGSTSQAAESENRSRELKLHLRDASISIRKREVFLFEHETQK